MLPNTKYYKIRLTVPAGSIFLISLKVNGESRSESYQLVDEVEEEFYLTEAQCNYYARRRIIEAHIKSALRKDIEKYELGREKVEFDEYGNEISWDIIEGNLEPKNLMMWNVPHHRVEVLEERYTDHNGNLIRKEEIDDGESTI